MIRWLGFILVVSGASAAGISMAASVRRSGELLRQAQVALQYMRSEIEFHLTPVPEICRQLELSCRKPLGTVFGTVGESLRHTPCFSCGVTMKRALKKCGHEFSDVLKSVLTDLFDALGKQDVYAQLRAIDSALQRLQAALEDLQREKKDRCRAYQVMGVCAGLAVAVILI